MKEIYLRWGNNKDIRRSFLNIIDLMISGNFIETSNIDNVGKFIETYDNSLREYNGQTTNIQSNS